MGRLLGFFIVLSNVLFVGTQFDIDIDRKRLIMQSLAQCRNVKNLTLIWYDFRIRYIDNSGSATFSIKTKVTKEISTDLRIVFDLMKCDASGNPDSCEYILKDQTVREACKHMVAKNQAWTRFVETFDKPLKCPIKPGVYTLKDYEIRTEILNYLPVSDDVWKAKFDAYDRGTWISCVQVVVRIVPYVVKRS